MLCKQPSLTVVGTGIKFLSQLTLEARTYIEKADKVLFLVNDPALKQWFSETNINSESLDEIYFKYTQRIDSYNAITQYILSHLLNGIHVCVAFYGHPTVFAQSALDAVTQAKEKGYHAKVLPGISAEDCLFADLLIDPGTCGCQSFESTDFLLYRRKFDSNSHLILWQPDVIGRQDHDISQDRLGLQLLQNYLIDFYSPDHEIIVYEAAQYPGIQPKLIKTELSKLSDSSLSPISTLYIKPRNTSKLDVEMAKKLNLIKR